MTDVSAILGEIIEPVDEAAPPPPSTALTDGFRAAMRRLASGIGVITVDGPSGLHGITATSLTSLSMSPPSILASIQSRSRLLANLRETAAFTVHLLGEDQAYQADVFAGRTGAMNRAAEVEWHPCEQGATRLGRAIAHIDCKLVRLIPVYTHLLVIGRASRVSLGGKERPLVYFEGTYHRLVRDRTAGEA